MNAAVCTMFEGDYHLGLGVLVNSLHGNGFRGKIWAGYRGERPPWAATTKEHAASAELQVGDGCVLHLVPLTTEAHLTNFKPEFMLDVMDRLDPTCGALFYIDPDIVVAEPWRSFEEWITCGLAVCEDINSPMPLHHPQRIGWRRCFEKFGFKLAPRESCYANGGFVGVAREERRFLDIWKRLQEAMWTVIGGSEFAGIPGGKSVAGRSGFFDCFGKTDQDALNAAIEAAADVPVSFLGRKAMGFEPGSPIIPHALGPMKPWRNRPIWNALRGMGCPVTDKHFWRFAEHPIRVYPSSTVKRRKLALRVAGAIARFMRRG